LTVELRPEVATLRHVTRYFDSLWGGRLVRALADVSLEVRQGEVFGLVGPAGSGKSTTLELLAGRLRGEGKVRVFGRSPRRWKVRARIGHLPGEARGAESLAKPGVSAFLGRMLRLVPGAWTRTAAHSLPAAPRRAILARLFFKPPDLLLLDEPFLGLDEADCREIKDSILKLAQNGATIVITSQSLSEVKDVCSRVAIYFDGRIEAVGSVEELPAMPSALRLLAPVLSASESERLLQIVCEGLRSLKGGHPTGSAVRCPPFRLSGPDKTAATRTGVSGTATAQAEQFLAPLTQPPAPVCPPRSAELAVDPVDHEKLAQLTQSAQP
jgi:ABC-2 type transport system ATP-binding protein